MKSFWFYYFIVSFTTYCFSQNQFTCYYIDEGKTCKEHLVDYEHLELYLKFDTVQSKIDGKVVHYFRSLRNNLDSLVLDAVDISIKKIHFQNQEVQKYKQQNNILTIYLPKQLSKNEKSSISIEYECLPKKGMYFIGWNDSLKYSKRQIWTQGQGIDNRHWIPMFDDMSDKITTDITVVFNKKYKVLSNGVLLEEKELSNNLKQWRYKMNKPHAPYLIMLGIGDYKIKQVKSKRGVPINLWYYPDKDYCVPYTYRYSEELVDFFEKEIGVFYPWENYSQIPVQEYMYGAMENTTAIVFGDFLLIDEYSINDRDYLPVNAHELAHQWFGDFITARSPSHVWLQESFATHYNWLVEKQYFGKEHYDWARKSSIEGILKESEKNLYPISHNNPGTIRLYPKGAYVLHMIKYVIGETEYNAAIKRYLQQHAYQNTETNDLWLAIYEETGINLDWFFDEWIYRGGEPHYKVSFETYEKNNQSVGIFKVSQVHSFKDNVGAFKMPIVFEIHFTDGSKVSKKVMIDKKDQIVEILYDKNKTISYVLFDPNSNVLKKVIFEKPFEMLKNQATHATNLLDRYDAIVEMRNTKITDKRDFLIERFLKETHHSIKSEIISQLISDTLHSETIKLIQNALQDKDTRVVGTVIDKTTKIPLSLKEHYYQALKTKSYRIIAKTIWLLYNNYPQEVSKIMDNIKHINFNTTTDNRLVEITVLSVQYLANKDSHALHKIVLYASPSFEFRTRNNAFDALIRVNYFDDRVKLYLEQASKSANGRLAGPAKEALRYFEKQKNFR